jgi:hypothetical protein
MYFPGSTIMLFDGGSDPALAAKAVDLNVERCRYSKPLQHRKVIYFHFGLMRQLHEDGVEYDFLVTLDSDMLVVRSGLEQFLQELMRDSQYIATNFHMLGDPPYSEWQIGRHFLFQWSRWSHAFDCLKPAGCFNPGQTFRKALVDQIIENVKTGEVMRLVERSPLPSLEEVILPTLALSLGANPMRSPGSAAIQLKLYGADELASYLADESVFMIHKVSMAYEGKDRRYLRSVRRGEAPEHFVQSEEASAAKRFPRLRRMMKSMYYKYC